MPQIKTRQRVRELAEVYTHAREVNAMLDLVPDMFPTQEDPANTDRKFLEPACGSGNFLEEILRRKLKYVTTSRYGSGERYEHRVLRCLTSTYGIDIAPDNVAESRDRLKAVITSHLDLDRNTVGPTPGFAAAVDTILATNILCADTLHDRIELVEYKPGRVGFFTREWSVLGENGPVQGDLFGPTEPKRDQVPVHYSDLATWPGPCPASAAHLSAAELVGVR